MTGKVGARDPAHIMLEADCTGDETLWVFRYASYFKSISGCDLGTAVEEANTAYADWGNDPGCTPEEIASSDYAIATEEGAAIAQPKASQ